MKGFFRTVGASLLCVILLVFALWRYEMLPDASALTDWLKDLQGQGGSLQQTPGNGSNESGTPSRPIETRPSEDGYLPTDEIEEDLLEVICTAYAEHWSSVDLSSFELTADELKAVVSGVRYASPQYFYVSNEYTFSSNRQSGFVTELKPTYLVDKETAQQQTLIYEQYVAEIVAGAPANGSDFEKVLYLHDYFVKNYSYDYDYEIRDAYTFFQEKEGVCQAYMLAFIATADALGIRSVPVTSNAMNHAWNLVEVDGTWYHMDITWDDTGSYASMTSYAYFLQSDTGIQGYDEARTDDPAEIHHEWTAVHAATDTRYDNAVWRGSVAPIVTLGGNYYCIVAVETGAGGYLLGGEDPLAMDRITKVDGMWRVRNTSSYYPGCYSGLAVLGDELIYNTDKTMRAYNVKTGKDRLLGIPSLRQTQSLYGVCGVNAEARELTVVVAEQLSDENAFETVFIMP